MAQVVLRIGIEVRDPARERRRRPLVDSVGTERQRIRVLRWSLRQIGPYVAFGLGAVLAPASGTPEFFGATAQIIPVLLLVLAVDADVFRYRRDLSALPSRDSWAHAVSRPSSAWQFSTRLLVFAALAYAEILSLRGLGDEGVGELWVRFICGAIVASIGGIAALTVLPRRDEKEEATTRDAGELAP